VLDPAVAGTDNDARSSRRSSSRPNTLVSGGASRELPLPSHFEETSARGGEDDTAESVVCGPDPERHVEAIREFVDAGYDSVYFHQVGPDQEGFLRFAEDEVLSRLADVRGD
jgi:coenzyme F420-dependent glucose-6-phosphate dehydrogenase